MYGTTYLMHYGIPGMRWGHHMPHKEARKEYNKIYDQEYSRESKGAKKMEAKMLEYANKHKLAYDDGGGGTDRQRRTYERMSEKQWIMEDEADYRAKQISAKKFVDKYGEREYLHMKTVDNIQLGGAVALVLGLPIVALGGISALLIKG